jgi:uncharacterized membrane protein YozB (DUF420 family)
VSIYDLPALNALLNSVATVLLVAGYLCIRAGNQRAHIACMASALVVSAAFLTSYLVYHAHAGSVKFTATGPVRPVYFALLLSHLVLAIANAPMVVLTVVPALRQRFDRHKKVARWTLPVWLYVSVTGVLVYLMLYQWFPPREVLERRGAGFVEGEG